MDDCYKFHEMHRTIASEQGREFTSAVDGISISRFNKDAAWSNVIELTCVKADGKTVISAYYGVRCEMLEKFFSERPHSLSISKFVTLDPQIDKDRLLSKLEHISQELHQLLTDIDSVEALIEKVDRQGGETLVFGSWTHERSFPLGRTADEMRKAIL